MHQSKERLKLGVTQPGATDQGLHAREHPATYNPTERQAHHALADIWKTLQCTVKLAICICPVICVPLAVHRRRVSCQSQSCKNGTALD